MIKEFIDFVRQIYSSSEFIPLHEPTFKGNESLYVNKTIESTFVSSIGEYVDSFEEEIAKYTGTAKAVATVNATTALQTALLMANVQNNDLVITQAFTFVATCNAISHAGAEPIFIDISEENLGLCPVETEKYLEENAVMEGAICKHRFTGQKIKAILPMHTYGHPGRLDELYTIAQKWNLALVEDAAESLGSFYKGQHTGIIGDFGVLSFNGNKIITTGGGGMILCKDKQSGEEAKHLTTTAKIPHPYEFKHDKVGFNFRMPNINAALGCAQLEQLDKFIERKRTLAMSYNEYFLDTDCNFVTEPEYAKSNYWLNSIVMPNKKLRDEFLKKTNNEGIMTRPAWILMHNLPMFQNSLRGNLKVSESIGSRLVNLPSSPIL